MALAELLAGVIFTGFVELMMVLLSWVLEVGCCARLGFGGWVVRC